jgi:hypothetical protein
MSLDTIHLRNVSSASGHELVLQEGCMLAVGRGQRSGIRSSSVSRQHCELYWRQRPAVQVTAVNKAVFIARASGDVVTITPGSVNEVRLQVVKHLHVVRALHALVHVALSCAPWCVKGRLVVGCIALARPTTIMSNSVSGSTKWSWSCGTHHALANGSATSAADRRGLCFIGPQPHHACVCRADAAW